MYKRCLSCAHKAFLEPVRDRLAYLTPQRRGMGKMCIERVRQPDLAVAQFGEVAVGKGRIDEIAGQPKIHIRTQRLNTVESQRQPVWHINMKQPNAGIDTECPKGNRQLDLAESLRFVCEALLAFAALRK